MNLLPVPDFKAAYDAALWANAAYIDDDAKARAAFLALGCNVIDRVAEIGYEAVLFVAPDGVYTLANTGSRVSEGTDQETVNDLFQDAKFEPVPAQGGGQVAAGAYARASLTYPWALARVPSGEPIRVIGHSLGGQESCLAPIWIDGDRLHSIIAFEPPKAADADFYHAHPDEFAKCVAIFHKRDPWAAWPWFVGVLAHPVTTLWLRGDGSYSFNDWPGMSFPPSWSDHDTDQVIATLAAMLNIGTPST